MGELPAEARLGAIRLRAGDVERLREFYETTIGLPVLGPADGVTSLGVNGAPLVGPHAQPRRPQNGTVQQSGSVGCNLHRPQPS